MDQASFDRMARLIGGAVTRRAGIAAALGAALGGPAAVGAGTQEAGRRGDPGGGKDDGKGAGRGEGAGPGTEAGSRPAGPCGDRTRKDNACRKDKDCCTGYCKKKKPGSNKDGLGRCRCIKCGKACKPSQTCCGGLACMNGKCEKLTSCVTQGAACLASSQCCAGLACAGGVCVTGVATSKACGTSDVCVAASAACTHYAEWRRDGDYTIDTFCLLPNGDACTGDNDCASGNCKNGVCANFACDVCKSGCPSDDLDQTLADAADGAVIRVDAGTWYTTVSSTPGPHGGDIADGRTITVRACNGADVTVTSTDYWVFSSYDWPDKGGHWVLEGLKVVPAKADQAGGAVYMGNVTAPVSLTARQCTFINEHLNPDMYNLVEMYRNSNVDLTDCELTLSSSAAFIAGSKVSRITANLTRVKIHDNGWHPEDAYSSMNIGNVDLTMTDCELTRNQASGCCQWFYTPGIFVECYPGQTGSNIVLAGTTTISENSTPYVMAGAMSLMRGYDSTVCDHTVSIAPTAEITRNTAWSTGIGGIAFDTATTVATGGSLTVTGADRIFDNFPNDCGTLPGPTQVACTAF
ncbi:MAG: hypothetical protein ACKOWF_01560 [Chloroflexota bacterium]